MNVRKNAKFLDATERENLVRAFVFMKADIVNPGASPADRYSRWDELVAIHRMIQSANAPGAAFPVNFGHGGSGAYGFFPWHRYFLYLLEQRLQGYVPGVMLPYWDWTDPFGTLLVDDFLSPDGESSSNNEIRQGFFAKEAPGTGANMTAAPAWWPSSLSGWNMHDVFGSYSGALRRNLNSAASLPSAPTLRSALEKTTYPAFQNAVETGSGTSPFHQLHNGLHGWIGGHMGNPFASPSDPIFYLHHCNCDRLWAMWQVDGHETEYPLSGGRDQHHRDDPMYPWVGTLGGYSSNVDFSPIMMRDYSSLGVVTAADVLDHRALGYTYDTITVVGVGLDRTGSMTGMTPDPMTTAAPDVTKWEAATRGVSAFLQDCETAYESGETYVIGGIKTFRSLVSNQFDPVFSGTPYGLVKPGGGYSRAVFDAAIASQTPGGGTPLADALADVHATLVTPPFGGPVGDEQRHLALLTDGLLTTGSPLSSIPDGSLANTAVFAMGFGTGADVDYATLSSIVNKGAVSLTTQQVFHGENAGVIDKFYSQALAAAIGFTPVMDPLLELFAGEHTHFSFSATSAEDAFLVTVQGMDFDDGTWSYQLVGPDGQIGYMHGSLPPHTHGGGGHGGGGRRPHVTARNGRGRLSLMLRRDSADASAWIGEWTLVVAWRARDFDSMIMFDPSEFLFPIAAGPQFGPRYARLLVSPEKRLARRALKAKSLHRLANPTPAMGRQANQACDAVVNVYAKTRLQVTLQPEPKRGRVGKPFAINIVTDVIRGSTGGISGYSRLVAPVVDIKATLKAAKPSPSVRKQARLKDGDRMALDSALVLAHLESKTRRIAKQRDEELPFNIAPGKAPRLSVEKTNIPGTYSISTIVRGLYFPEDSRGGRHRNAGSQAHVEPFTRILSVTVGLPPSRRPKTSRSAGSSPRKKIKRR